MDKGKEKTYACALKLGTQVVVRMRMPFLSLLGGEQVVAFFGKINKSMHDFTNINSFNHYTKIGVLAEMDSILIYLVLLLCLILTIADCKSIRTTYANYHTQYTRTEIYDNIESYSEDYGQLASFSNKSVSSVSGRLYEPDSLFGCVGLDSYNSTNQTPKRPFVVFLPLLTNCNPYVQSTYAEQIGAVGVLFYSRKTSKSLTIYHTSLSVLVSLVTLTDDEVTSLKQLLTWNETNITLDIRESTYSIHKSHTFYFVVFAFSVLILLSITWFIVTYIRRCHGICVQKYRRVSSSIHYIYIYISISSMHAYLATCKAYYLLFLVNYNYCSTPLI